MTTQFEEDDDEARAHTRRLFIDYFRDDEIWWSERDRQELIVYNWDEEESITERDRKTWCVEWLAGPDRWAFGRFPASLLPEGTWTDAWDQKELLIHFPE